MEEKGFRIPALFLIGLAMLILVISLFSIQFMRHPIGWFSTYSIPDNGENTLSLDSSHFVSMDKGIVQTISKKDKSITVVFSNPGNDDRISYISFASGYNVYGGGDNLLGSFISGDTETATVRVPGNSFVVLELVATI